MDKEIPFIIADRLTEEWSPAMRETAKEVVAKLEAAKTIEEWRKIVESFRQWTIDHRQIQF